MGITDILVEPLRKLVGTTEPPAPVIEKPAETKPETSSGTGNGTAGTTETAPAKPNWEAYSDKSEYRRDYNRWVRHEQKLQNEREPDGLKAALDAQRRAEELTAESARRAAQAEADARAAAPPPKPPEISQRKRELLKLNPHLGHAVLGPTITAIHNAILQHGVVDDSDEYIDQMANALGQVGIRFDKPQLAHEQQHEPVSEPSHHEPEPAYEPEPAPLASVEPPTPPPAPVRPQSRIPMSAPVSRSAPSYGNPTPGRVTTLSAEEREIAHKSFTDSNMSNAEKEKLYAAGKAKYQARMAGGWKDERHGQ